MRVSASILALAAIAGAQAASLHRRHEHHKRGGYEATPVQHVEESCKPVVTGRWVALKERAAEPAPPPTFTYKGDCQIPTPIVTPCNEPGTYVFPAHEIKLDTLGSYGGVEYKAGIYRQREATYQVTAPTTITCPFEYVGPIPGAEPTPVPQSYDDNKNNNDGGYQGEEKPGKDNSYDQGQNQGQQPGGGAGGSPGNGYEGGAGGSPDKGYDNGGDQGGDDKDYNGGSSGGSGIHDGKQWAITYSPYKVDGCTSEDEVKNDIQDIKRKGFRAVRVYSTDCDTLKHVGAACQQYGVGIILGAFIKKGPNGPDFSQADGDIKATIDFYRGSSWKGVQMFVVGNEAVLSGACTLKQLTDYVSSARGKLRAGGYQGPVTTAETLNIYEDNEKQGGDLCSCQDQIGINIHPYFNTENLAQNAGKFMNDQLSILKQKCPGKPVVSLETGWPNGGNANGAAVPGPNQQGAALKSIYEHENGGIAYFTYTKDDWKQPGQYGVEQKFSCAQLFKSGGGI